MDIYTAVLQIIKLNTRKEIFTFLITEDNYPDEDKYFTFMEGFVRDLSDSRLYDTFNGASFTLSLFDLLFGILAFSPLNIFTISFWSWAWFPTYLVKTAYETVGPIMWSD